MLYILQFASNEKAGTTNSYRGYLGAICYKRGGKRPEGTLGNSLTYKFSQENLFYSLLKNRKSWYRRNAGNHDRFIFQVHLWWKKETARSMQNPKKLKAVGIKHPCKAGKIISQ